MWTRTWKLITRCNARRWRAWLRTDLTSWVKFFKCQAVLIRQVELLPITKPAAAVSSCRPSRATGMFSRPTCSQSMSLVAILPLRTWLVHSTQWHQCTLHSPWWAVVSRSTIIQASPSSRSGQKWTKIQCGCHRTKELQPRLGQTEPQWINSHQTLTAKDKVCLAWKCSSARKALDYSEAIMKTIVLKGPHIDRDNSYEILTESLPGSVIEIFQIIYIFLNHWNTYFYAK